MEGKRSARVTCDACGDNVGNNGKYPHFQTKHPEFKFHLEKKSGLSRVTCDVCQRVVDSYGDLVKSHRHPAVPIAEVKPADQIDKFISNIELILQRYHEMDAENKGLRVLLGNWENRAARLNDDINTLLHRDPR